MKKLFLLAIVAAFSACSNDENVISPEKPEPQTVKVSLNYSLLESGSMTRSGDNVYTSFYEKYIKTKILTPKTYSLAFNSDKAILEVIQQGVWGNNDAIELFEGSYSVSGNSNPKFRNMNYPDVYVCDSLYLNFNENITINKNTTNITLKGIYNCYLLLFDATNISSITSSFGREEKALPKKDDIYFLFVESDYYATASSATTYLNIHIVRPNGATVDLNIGKLKLEKGKYYYFNDTTNSFDIEPMENGKQN